MRAITHRRTVLRTGLAFAAGDILLATRPSANHSHARETMPRDLRQGIAELRLQTTQREALHRFYEHVLQLPVERKGEALHVVAGGTRIVFESASTDQEPPFYHFAFNIPRNKLEAARRWQKERTSLVRRGSAEVIHFAHWNAHSVFFNDPAGNILEYIARHDLQNAAEGDFSPADILYASEIGLVVDDVLRTADEVKARLGIKVYRDLSDNFASLGDAHALVLLVKRNRLWTPDRTRAAKVFPTTAAVRGDQPRSFSPHGYPYQISLIQ